MAGVPGTSSRGMGDEGASRALALSKPLHLHELTVDRGFVRVPALKYGWLGTLALFRHAPSSNGRSAWVLGANSWS